MLITAKAAVADFFNTIGTPETLAWAGLSPTLQPSVNMVQLRFPAPWPVLSDYEEVLVGQSRLV
jgi:hypothetical protein